MFRRIRSIERIAGPTRVYNFHVPGPESFIANGIVTHNCYVPRRKGFANPISTFVNVEQIQRAILRHAEKQGPKTAPTTAGDSEWIYELGCNSDLSLDAAICDNARDLIAAFRRLPHARATFATKFVNRELLGYDPQRKTRMRFSLMPPRLSKLVDVRTTPIAQRVAAINDFHEAGYEMNVNFSPVIFQENWEAEWRELFQMVDGSISDAVKKQLSCEVIFLTHNDDLHKVNEEWHPRAEEVLWQPDIQESKVSEGMPYCRVRYAF